MKIESHLDKFRRLHEMQARLDPSEDRELWIWTAMNASVNLLNASLHRHGITREADSFHTQIDGLYVVPDRRNGTLHDSLELPGDVMHVGQPALDLPLPPAIERAGRNLRTIEDLREPYVRGNGVPPAGIEHQWQAAYAQCVRELCQALDLTPPQS